MKTHDRIEWLDLVRSIAIIAVVMCHVVVQSIYEFNVSYMNVLNCYTRGFAFTIYTFGRIGVPLFLFISGYLLLDKEYDNDACINFWKKKWLGLLWVIEVWVVLYNLFLCVYTGYEISGEILFKEMTFTAMTPISHIWYMPMILGMYLTLPLASNALVKLQTKVILIPFVVLAVLCWGIPFAKVFYQFYGQSLSTSISLGHSGGVYGLYIIAGCLLKRGILRDISSKVLKIALLISFCVTVGMQLFMYKHGMEYNIWYDNILLVICGILLFELLSRCRIDGVGKKITYEISRFSFAIYLVHNPIVMILKDCTENIANRVVRVFLVSILTLVFSYIVARLIYSIPKVGKKILYMK